MLRRAQRDPLHDELFFALQELAEVPQRALAGNFPDAQRRGRRVAGVMLLLADLRWDRGDGGDAFVIVPAEVLVPTLALLQGRIRGSLARHLEAPTEREQAQNKGWWCVRAVRACHVILADLALGAGEEVEPMPVTVRLAERDALWELIRTLLASIDNIFRAVDTGRPDEARRLRHRYSDLLRLLDDLGWGREAWDPEYAITMEPDALRRALLHLHEHAVDRLRQHADEGDADRDELRTAAIGASVCGRLLVQLAHATDTAAAEEER